MDYQQIPVRRQRPVRTREGVPVITFTPPRTCNPVPSPQSQKPSPPQGQNGHCGGEQESWTDFQFVAHVGSLNREGVASTRKATTEKKRYTVNRFRACAASVPLQSLTVAAELSVASTAPEMASMLESLEMGVERQRTTRRSRATVEGMCLLLVTSFGVCLLTNKTLLSVFRCPYRALESQSVEETPQRTRSRSRGE